MTTTTAAPAPGARAADWTPVCRYDDLLPERGVAALVRGEQVAVFRLYDGAVHAVQQRDPFSGAYVISRGIVGTRGDAPTVASPMYKQAFDLRTGECLDDPAERLAVYAVRVIDGVVLVGPGHAGHAGLAGLAAEPDPGAG